MAQFTKNNKRNPLERTSSQGLVLGCPICAAKLDLLDTRDGDQAYWCHRCQSGWRAGNLPEAAHRSKDKQSLDPEPPVETPAAKEPRVGVSDALRAKAKQPVAQPVAPKPPATAKPSRSSPRAADVAPSTPKTAALKNALEKAQKKPSSEISPRNPRRVTQTPEPTSKPLNAKRQPLEVAAKPKTSTPRVAAQKPPKKALETVASASPPKRTKRPSLETAAPIRAVTPRVKRSEREQPITGKGSRKPAAPKAATGKGQRLEVTAQPKISARAAAQKAFETVAKVKTPARPAKRPRREQPLPETNTGSRKVGQIAAPSPRTATGKRQRLEVAAPKISATRAVSQKKTLEAGSVGGKKSRTLAFEPTPKPRRANARTAEALQSARAAPEQRKSRNVPIGTTQIAPVSQARAQRPTAPLEPLPKPRRAARVAAQTSPAPVKSLKPAPAKPEPTRTARVTKPLAAVAPRPKPIRSSPARPAPANPVQFGLFDAPPPKTTGRKQR